MERLYKKLTDYCRKDYYPFHMPGHKRNTSCVDGDFCFDRDITEIDGFDNLHHPEGILKEAQETVSKIYGSRESWYSINGSTGALLAAISASVPRGGRILMARNSHKAVYHAVYLRNLEVSYVYPQTDGRWWINGGILPDKVERVLAKNPDIKAVLITSPTYDGIVSDIRKIADAVHRYKIPLIVDEAHGAHFCFSEYFPASAGELGADLVIQSLHKTLPSMTQTAVLHQFTDCVDNRLIRRFMDIYQSSSPSYILMAGMDACMDKISSEGEKLFKSFTENLEKLRRRLSSLKFIRLVSPIKGENGIFDFDRSKLIFSVKDSSLTGHELYQILLDRYHIQMEMESEFYVLGIASVGDRPEGFERLCLAIEEIDREEASKFRETRGQDCSEERRISFTMNQVMSITKAMESESEICSVNESIGRISAEFGYLYPPGTPFLVPGEQITGQFVRNMRIYKERGLCLQGLEDYSNETIRVVCRRDRE